VSFSRVINLYLNLDAQAGNPLVTSLLNIQSRATPQFVQGDTATLRIWPATETGNATSPLLTSQLVAGTNIAFAGKSSSALSALTLLFSALSWTAHNTEIDNSGNWYYEAELNLNTSELDTAITALSGTATGLAVKCDIELQNADNSQRLTYQFDATVLRQVYDGEASPTPGTPTYPLPGTLAIKGTSTPDMRLDITGLTGGTATDLDGIVTLGATVPQVVMLVIGGAAKLYRLAAGTTAEASPGIIRPDDYASSTNEKIWTQIL
jgi:hypothetical protein